MITKGRTGMFAQSSRNRDGFHQKLIEAEIHMEESTNKAWFKWYQVQAEDGDGKEVSKMRLKRFECDREETGAAQETQREHDERLQKEQEELLTACTTRRSNKVNE